MQADLVGNSWFWLWFLSILGLGSIIASLVTGSFLWWVERRKFEKQQRIADLKERLDNFYSPLVFHFENMRSWAEALKSSEEYAFARKTLEAKIGDMNSLMRLGLRHGSARVRDLWYEWQPFAVAVVEGREVYPTLADPDEFLNRSKRLHEALKEDCDKLLEQYWMEIGRV